MQLAELEEKTLQELQEMAKELNIEHISNFRKRELIFEMLKVLAVKEGLIFSQGILEILPDGFGVFKSGRF